MMKLRVFNWAILGLTGFVLTATSSAFAAPQGDFNQGVTRTLTAYLKIQQALASDSLAGISEEAKRIGDAASSLDISKLTGADAAHFASLPAELKAAANQLRVSKSIQDARAAFKSLSAPLALWAKIKRPAGIHIASCSMAGASWLQKESDIRNPYYGKSMLTCGEMDSAPGQGCCNGH